MLPTPTTAHLTFTHIYEPSEDTFLLLDTLTLQSPFLRTRFPESSPAPLVLELGSGSGVVTSFLTTHSAALFGHSSIATLSTDISPHAPEATRRTVAANATTAGEGCFLGAMRTDLAAGLRPGVVDVLVFNPPYVPTEAVGDGGGEEGWIGVACGGGVDGMEVTVRVLAGLGEWLSGCGVAYILLCERNGPEAVAERLRSGEYGVKWVVEKVGTSGRKGGWEVLGIWRVMRW